MDEKENAKFSIVLLGAILLIFILADLLTADRFYSEAEMRLLAGKPVISLAGVLSGTFQEQYANAVGDQFPGREKLAEIRDNIERLLGKDEEDGVYFCDDGYLAEVHHPENYPGGLQQEKISRLKSLVEKWGADVMLVPTADNILTEKLPFSAPYFDEEQFLESVKTEIGEDHFIDVYSVLMQHKDETVFYKTDSHWTSLGAYYGYQAWAEHEQKAAFAFDTDNMTTVSIDFRGDLHKRVPLDKNSDEIKVFTETLDEIVLVTYEDGRTAASFYSDSYLTGNDQYGYFLDHDHGLVTIKTNSAGRRKLLLVKGSYGNAFVPLLCRNYTDIYVYDPEKYGMGVEEFLADFKIDALTDILLLYDCVELLENF